MRRPISVAAATGVAHSARTSRLAEALRGAFRGALWAAVCTAVWGGPAPAAPAHAADTSLQGRPCPFFVPFGEAAQCGSLTVSADHDRPEAGVYEVFFAMLRSHAASPDPDPIVYLAGGPGQAMSDFADTMWSGTLADRARRDVILFDMRGTGRSQPMLDCADVDDDVVDGNPANDGASADPARVAAALAACREGYAREGIDISLFDSEQAARDLMDLRAALGIARWNIVGTSYGTRLALEAARQDPEGIRSLVLNSTMTMGDAFEPQTFDDRVRILDRLFADCAANPDCNGAYPDLRARFEELRSRLNAQPMLVHVVPPPDAHPRPDPAPGPGGTMPVTLDFATFVGILMTHLSFQPGAEMVPMYIDRVSSAAAGRETLTDADWREFLGPGLLQGEGLAIGLYLSVVCREIDPVHDREGVAAKVAERELFAARDLDMLQTNCPAWQAGQAREGFADPVESDIPALLLFGEYDPLTPPYWTAAAAGHLANGRAIAFPGAAHDVLGTSLCARTIVTAFIRDPEAELDTSCAEGQVPRFFTPASDRRGTEDAADRPEATADGEPDETGGAQ